MVDQIVKPLRTKTDFRIVTDILFDTVVFVGRKWLYSKEDAWKLAMGENLPEIPDQKPYMVIHTAWPKDLFYMPGWDHKIIRLVGERLKWDKKGQPDNAFILTTYVNQAGEITFRMPPHLIMDSWCHITIRKEPNFS